MKTTAMVAKELGLPVRTVQDRCVARGLGTIYGKTRLLNDGEVKAVSPDGGGGFLGKMKRAARAVAEGWKPSEAPKAAVVVAPAAPSGPPPRTVASVLSSVPRGKRG